MTTLEELEEAIGRQQQVIDDLIAVIEEIAGGARAPISGRWTAYRSSTDADENGAVPAPATDEAWAKQLDDLAEWLDWAWPRLLKGHANAKTLPECWRNHEGAVEELLALYSAWLVSYASDDANEARIAWHDRWAPGSAQRVIGAPYLLGNCSVSTCSAARQRQRSSQLPAAQG